MNDNDRMPPMSFADICDNVLEIHHHKEMVDFKLWKCPYDQEPVLLMRSIESKNDKS